MKWTKKKIVYNVLMLVFYGVIPLVLIFMQYSNLGHSTDETVFKIAAPGILLLILVYLCFKKLFINKKLTDAHAQLNQLKADLRVKTDSGEVANIEKAIKNLGTLDVALNAVVPILLFVLTIVCCKVMEQGLVKLSGTCGFILLSYAVGLIFAVLDAREVKSKNVVAPKAEESADED